MQRFKALFSNDNSRKVQQAFLRDGPLKIFLLVIVNATAGIMYGYNIGIVASALAPIERDFDLLQYNVYNVTNGNTTTTIRSITATSSLISGFLAAGMLFGALFSAIIGAKFVDLIGRRGSLFVVFLCSFCGILISALVTVYPVVIVFRAFVGFSIGIANISCNMFVAEMAPMSYRGVLGAIFPLGLSTGLLLAYLIGFGYSYAPYDWRFMLGTALIMSVMYLILYVIIPESPIWLAMNKSSKFNAFFQGVPQIIDQPNLFRSNTNLARLMSRTIKTQSTWRKKVKNGIFRLKTQCEMLYFKNLRKFLVGILLCIDLQVTGGPTILLYAPSIFISTGVANGVSPLVPSIILGVWYLFTVLIALPVIRRVGRRILILFGLSGQFISTFVIAFNLYYVQGSAKGYVMIPMLMMFYFCFNWGVGNLVYVVLNELFPTEIRAFAVGQLTAILWFISLAINLLFPLLVNAIGLCTMFWIFSGISFFSVILLGFGLPETRKMVLAKVERPSAIRLEVNKPEKTLDFELDCIEVIEEIVTTHDIEVKDKVTCQEKKEIGKQEYDESISGPIDAVADIPNQESSPPEIACQVAVQLEQCVSNSTLQQEPCEPTATVTPTST
jgi:sugar porter (SP) family MFS transporter